MSGIEPIDKPTTPAEKDETMPREEQTYQAPSLSREECAWRLQERQAAALAKSTTAIPRAFQGKPADIIAAWMMGDELGISRMSMLRGAYVVNGKPQLSGDLLLAVARATGAKVTEWIEEGETEKAVVAHCEVELRSGETVTASFSVEDAIQAGLWAGSDPWKKYPKRMLQMRARGFALRDAIPDKLAGVYAPGEIIDVTPEGEL